MQPEWYVILLSLFGPTAVPFMIGAYIALVWRKEDC